MSKNCQDWQLKRSMAYSEEDFLMISGIQHFVFCRRQWALIHIEQQWAENVLTVEGQDLHKKADQPFIREKRGDRLIVRAMPVQSYTLGITGICDVVEFVQDPNGITLQQSQDTYRVYPVEYKRGKPKWDASDMMQLLAQAMCLEEMLMCEIPEGFVYYHEIKHREKISFTQEHRTQLKTVLDEMHQYYSRRYTPKVKTGKFCLNCSLKDECLPVLMNKQSVKSYIEGALKK